MKSCMAVGKDAPEIGDNKHLIHYRQEQFCLFKTSPAMTV